MKRNIKYSFLAITMLSFGLVSCNKYLDKAPLSSITSEAFYSNAQEVDQALTGVYSAFGARTVSPGFSNPTTYYSKMDLYTEIGLERGLNGTIASGAYNSTNGTVSELWSAFYQVIQRANNLLFFMQKARGVMTTADYNRVVAEASTLRALAYWHLVVYFGDVFFYTQPLTQEQIGSPTRTPKSQIIDFLVADMRSVAASLPWTPTQRGRVSRGVALGAAARLAMVDKKWSTVISLTDDIIANGGYGLNPSFENLFRKAGMESNIGNEIMFYYPFGDNDAGSFSYLQLVQGSRNNGGQSSHFPSQFLVDLFECTDGLNIAQSPLYNPAKPNANRDPRMKQTVIVPGDTILIEAALTTLPSIVYSPTDRLRWTFNRTTQAITTSTAATNIDSSNVFGPRLNGLGNLWRKYVQDRDINGTAGNLFRVGWIYMRYAEILHMNAEAKLENGSPATEVVANINRIRNRGGMPNVSAAVIGNANAFKQLVRREKTVEFANEGIHMADLRRWDDGAYAARVMPVQMYGASISNMRLQAGVGLVYNDAPTTPTFDATYLVPMTYTNGDAQRLKRELRLFVPTQHILCPIPQVDIDRSNGSLKQNPGW
jgi:starch-binding outer membrane protein, SusD/RagB family